MNVANLKRSRIVSGIFSIMAQADALAGLIAELVRGSATETLPNDGGFGW